MYGNMKRILLPSPLKNNNNNNKVKIIIKPNLKTTNNHIRVPLNVKNLTICEYLKQYRYYLAFYNILLCVKCVIYGSTIYHRLVV